MLCHHEIPMDTMHCGFELLAVLEAVCVLIAIIMVNYLYKTASISSMLPNMTALDKSRFVEHLIKFLKEIAIGETSFKETQLTSIRWAVGFLPLKKPIIPKSNLLGTNSSPY